MSRKTVSFPRIKSLAFSALNPVFGISSPLNVWLEVFDTVHSGQTLACCKICFSFIKRKQIVKCVVMKENGLRKE